MRKGNLTTGTRVYEAAPGVWIEGNPCEADHAWVCPHGDGSAPNCPTALLRSCGACVGGIVPKSGTIVTPRTTHLGSGPALLLPLLDPA